MAERKWGAISSGETFESLATTIVFFEDPGAALFGRRGKDGGQDARSGCGTCVFQAKHHASGSAAAAIRDAQAEAAKIQAYRTPGHARHAQWATVTHWRLVTNAVFNPTDKQNWDTIVVPLFAAMGLHAEYWERANLDALLDKHPEIHRSFFENETRAFLSVPEAGARLPLKEPFLRRGELGSFCGRKTEIAAVRAFLMSAEVFLLVHGAGGVGKTRLLIEGGEEVAAEGIWQVLWANVESMTANATWFESIVPERPTLLLVDEPPDERLLQQLSEQVASRAAQWKIAVAVRSPKDPVLRFMFQARMKPRVTELAISQLPQTDAEEMCFNLLGSGAFAALPEQQRRHAARELSRRFFHHPIWLTLAVNVLEDRGDLARVPSTAEALATEYLDEIAGSQSAFEPAVIWDMLRWVALIGTLNRNDQAAVELVSTMTHAGGHTELLSLLASLVKRRALVQRGAYDRFVEIKPDVLRDHLLRDWLSTDVGYGEHPIVPSEQARGLIKIILSQVVTGDLNELWRSILSSLARTEFLFTVEGQRVLFLDELFEAIENAIPAMTPSRRIALAGALEHIAAFQPSRTARLIAVIRDSPATDETVDEFISTRTITHDDVVLALAWPLFRAAMGAQTVDVQRLVLRELCTLVITEAELAPHLRYGLPNDGRRAGALVERVVQGGPQFWGGEAEAASLQLGEDLILDLCRRPATVADQALCRALLRPSMALERWQTWADDHILQVQTFAITTDHPGWSTRESLIARTKAALSSPETPLQSRVVLWHLLAEAHRSVNRAALPATDRPSLHRDILLSDLGWAKDVLSNTRISVMELNAARELWDWHHSFESDEVLKALSDDLEALYMTVDGAAEFAPLFGRDNWEQRQVRSAAKAAEIAAAVTLEDIAATVDRAIVFFEGQQDWSPFHELARELGTHAWSRDTVQAFVRSCLARSEASPQSDFGLETAALWVASERQRDPECVHLLVADLMAACGSDAQRARFLDRIYGRPPPLSAAEQALLRAQKDLFLNTGRGAAFVEATAATLGIDWPQLRVLIDDVLGALSIESQRLALEALVDGAYRGASRLDRMSIPVGLTEWVLDHVIALPSFDELRSHAEWQLKELCKRAGPAPLRWLPSALRRRQAIELSGGGRAIAHDFRISTFVQHVTAVDVTSSEAAELIGELVDLATDDYTVGFYLPQILHDVDPDGLIVPALVARRLVTPATDKEHRALACIAVPYGVGSSSWRTIAKAAIASGRSRSNASSTFLSLEPRSRSWSAPHGEVAPVFRSAIDEASAALAAEVDVDLRRFWEWRLTTALDRLREEEQLAKERRGE